jgi:type III secretion protein L
MSNPDTPRKVIKKEVFSATLEAQTILDAARQEAEQILQEARLQRDDIVEGARHAGYQEGLTQWNEAMVVALRQKDQLLKDSEHAVVHLAVRVAEKIIGEQLLLSPQTIVSIVREGLKSIRSEKSLVLKVNPEHVELLRQSTHRLQDLLGTDCHIRVVGTPSVASGGCIIESELGVIDAQMETQLRCLEDALMRAART